MLFYAVSKVGHVYEVSVTPDEAGELLSALFNGLVNHDDTSIPIGTEKFRICANSLEGYGLIVDNQLAGKFVEVVKEKTWPK